MSYFPPTRRLPVPVLAFSLITILGLYTLPAHGGGVQEIESGLPVTVEDAYPTPYLGQEFQTVIRYDKLDTDEGGENLVVVEPRLELGWFRNSQFSLELPYKLGNATEADQGDIALEAFYNFNTESLQLPAFATSFTVSVPYGEDSHGAETTTTMIATKTLGKSWVNRQLHLNVSWIHKFSARSDEREDRYTAVLGYSHPLRSDMLFVGDVVREQHIEKGSTENLVEAGIRYQLTPLLILTGGAGAGFGDDSPDYRVLVGFQYMLSIFSMYD